MENLQARIQAVVAAVLAVLLLQGTFRHLGENAPDVIAGWVLVSNVVLQLIFEAIAIVRGVPASQALKATRKIAGVLLLVVGFWQLACQPVTVPKFPVAEIDLGRAVQCASKIPQWKEVAVCLGVVALDEGGKAAISWLIDVIEQSEWVVPDDGREFALASLDSDPKVRDALRHLNEQVGRLQAP